MARLRNFISSVIDYLVFGNIFIAICAVVMFRYTCAVFGLQPDPWFLPFVFFATLASYSLHWYLTVYADNTSVRLAWSAAHRSFLMALFVVSFVVTAVFVFILRSYFLVLLVFGFFTFFYTAPKIPVKPFLFLRRIPFLKTTYLALVWAAVTVILPVLVSARPPGDGFAAFALNRFFLIFPVCILFDYRDREEDSIAGIKNIATIVTPLGLDVVFSICTFFAAASAYIIFVQQTGWFLLAVNILPSAVLVLVYRKSKYSRSDHWYYLLLDGLMMLSGLVYLPFSKFLL